MRPVVALSIYTAAYIGLKVHQSINIFQINFTTDNAKPIGFRVHTMCIFSRFDLMTYFRPDQINYQTGLRLY